MEFTPFTPRSATWTEMMEVKDELKIVWNLLKRKHGDLTLEKIRSLELRMKGAIMMIANDAENDLKAEEEFPLVQPINQSDWDHLNDILRDTQKTPEEDIIRGELYVERAPKRPALERTKSFYQTRVDQDSIVEDEEVQCLGIFTKDGEPKWLCDDCKEELNSFIPIDNNF